MKTVSVFRNIYQAVETGKFYYRPIIRGKRTWRKLFAKTLAEAKVEYSHIAEISRAQRTRERLLEIATQSPTDLTHLPSCLFKYAHMVKVLHPPKPEKGLYFLMHGKECVYIGQSPRSVHIRIALHRLNKQFDKVFYIPFEDDLNTAERHFIALLKPKYNSKDIEGFVEEPFETQSQRKHRREMTREKVIQACIRCGDTPSEAKRKANFLLKGKNFDADLLTDELPTLEPARPNSKPRKSIEAEAISAAGLDLPPQGL